MKTRISNLSPLDRSAKLFFLLSALLTLSIATNSSSWAGTSSPEIVGGQVVAANDLIARRTVGLVMYDSQGRGGICTGAILSKSSILTAAHCVYRQTKVVIVFAQSNITRIAAEAISAQKSAGSNFRVAKNFRMLPGYTGQGGGVDEFNDLALVTFDGGLPEAYEPSHFLNYQEGLQRLSRGAPVILAGYGITSVEERDAVFSGPRTSGTLRKVGIRMMGFSPNKKNMILGGMPGRDACNGDSGGPAMVNVEGNLYVVGIASRSDCVTMSIYTWVPRERASKAAQMGQLIH